MAPAPRANAGGAAARRCWLASAADESYALPLAVMLRTVGERWEPVGSPLTVLVVDGGLSQRSREAIRLTVEDLPLEVRFVSLDTRRLDGLAPWRGSPFLTYARLLVPGIIPEETDRVVWLDADTYVRSDLSALWSIDLGGRPVGACRDFAVPSFSSALGVYDYEAVGDGLDHPYFNAGLLVCDIETWRREEVTERTLDFLHEAGRRPVLVDQEALNVVLVSKWHVLDPLWNVTGGLVGRGFYRPSTFRPDDSLEWRKARVVHFSGRLKPWRLRTGSLFQSEYEAAIERTRLPNALQEATVGTRLAELYDRNLRWLGHPFERALIWIQRRWVAPWCLRLGAGPS